MPPIHPIPLSLIHATALPRDRTGLDPEPLAELRRSILDHGLRLPVELFPLPGPPLADGRLYGSSRAAAASSCSRNWPRKTPPSPPSPP